MAAGTCPHCGARVELAPAVFARERRCDSCRGAYVAVLPEGVGAEDVGGDVELLALGERHGPPSAERRAERSLHRFAGVTFGAFVVVALLGVAAWAVESLRPPLVAAARGAVAAAVDGALYGALAALGGLVVYLALRGRVSDPHVLRRSLRALAWGVGALAAAQGFFSSVGPAYGQGRATFLIVAALIPGLASGALAARLAPSRPYAHALGISVGFAALWFGAVALSVARGGVSDGLSERVLAVLTTYVPALLAGAWLGARAAAPAGRPRAS